MSGFLPLEELIEEVSLNLGAVGIGSQRLKRWVNFGLQNLGSYVKFDELRATSPLAIVEGTTGYTLPTGLIGIYTITVDNRRVRKMQREFVVADRAGRPSHYIRRGTQIVLWPEPDDDYTGVLEYYKAPTPLSAAADVSPLSPTWDVAIVMLATYHAFMSLGQVEKAQIWLGQLLGYAASRLDEMDVSADAAKGGLNVAWDYDDITETPPHIIESE